MVPRNSSSWCKYRTGLPMVLLVLAMVAPLIQGAQPKDCELYQVSPDQPSPTLETTDSAFDIHISLDLLFENATATVNISNGESSSCEIIIDRTNGTMKGDCFESNEIPLKCSQDGGLDTIVLKRRKSVLVVVRQGDNSDSKVLNLKASNQNIQVQVNSDTIINTAFNCPKHCFKFHNAIIHSKENLTLSANQLGDEKAQGVIKVLHGAAWDKHMIFNFTYSQNNATGDDMNGLNLFYAASNYTNVTDGVTSLGVGGSLIGEKVPQMVGEVPSLDTYFQFEDMTDILWTVCEKYPDNQRTGRDIQGSVTENYPDNEITRINIKGSVTEMSKANTNDNLTTANKDTYSTTLDTKTESANTYSTAVETESNTGITERLTTVQREIEETSCKDTSLEKKCSLTSDDGGSCNCGEAKENGLCDKLDMYQDVKEHCKRTCGLCPDQVANIKSGGASSRVGEATSSAAPAGTASQSTASQSSNTVYIILGVVLIVLLMLLIWILAKRRKTSRTVDLESQSQTITVQESTEMPAEDKLVTDDTKKQEQVEVNKGAENKAFKEQEVEKKDTQIVDEKVNKDDINKNVKENSSTNKENNKIKDDSNSKSEKKTGDGMKTKGEEEYHDNIDDGLVNKKDKDELTQENKEKNDKIVKEDNSEKKNENDSKDIDDNLESTPGH